MGIEPTQPDGVRFKSYHRNFLRQFDVIRPAYDTSCQRAVSVDKDGTSDGFLDHFSMLQR